MPHSRARPALMGAALLLFGSPTPGAAQYSAEFEVETTASVTKSRFELLSGRFYAVRGEFTERASGDRGRLGVQIPGRWFGLDGYTSFFLEHDPGQTGLGTNFEMGRGMLAVGGSLERDTDDFTGAYLKFRGGDFDVAAGGGRRNEETVWHGAAYAKGVRWSMAAGGVVGPGDDAYQHVAGTWHPAPGTNTPGAWFQVEREGPGDYAMELNFADRGSFNYLTSWGAYNMDQWPHERTIEAMGDVMRYFLPSIRNHRRTAGRGVLGVAYEVRGSEGEFTVDARAYPFRWSRASITPGSSGTVGTEPQTMGEKIWARVLPSFMIGAAQNVTAGVTTMRAEVELSPVLIYFESDLSDGAEPYLFVQYVLRGL